MNERSDRYKKIKKKEEEERRGSFQTAWKLKLNERLWCAAIMQPEQQHPGRLALRRLPAVYLIATPSFCLPPLQSLPPARPCAGQMGIVRLGGAFQHRNLSPPARSPIRWRRGGRRTGGGPQSFHTRCGKWHMCGFNPCQHWRNRRPSGSESTGRQTDRRTDRQTGRRGRKIEGGARIRAWVTVAVDSSPKQPLSDVTVGTCTCLRLATTRCWLRPSDAALLGGPISFLG